MKIGVITKLAGEHSVGKLCRTLEMTRNAFYAAEKKPEAAPRPSQRTPGRENGRTLPWRADAPMAARH
jgi:hypothetical protein